MYYNIKFAVFPGKVGLQRWVGGVQKGQNLEYIKY